jgi:uncharacterized protein YbcV (DUF1398 family)
MNTEIIDKTTADSLAGKIRFPEVVMKLAAAGVERYRVDFVAKQKNSYGVNNEFYGHSFSNEWPPVATIFNATAVKSAIVASQQGEIDYKTFLNLITEAGCSHYEVFITAKKVIYYGRDGSQHVELFPSASKI